MLIKIGDVIVQDYDVRKIERISDEESILHTYNDAPITVNEYWNQIQWEISNIRADV